MQSLTTNRLHLHLSPRFDWLQYSDGLFFRSAAFGNQQIHQEKEIFERLASLKIEDDFISELKKINSFFSIIRYQSDQLYAAVDRVRSIPLFYGIENDNFYLSDDAKWVQEKVGDKERDPLAEAEFLLTGYVTGSDTLYPNVKQLQAGECLFVKSFTDEIQIKKERYFQYCHKYAYTIAETDLFKKFDKVLINIFENLANQARGRTFVIPLSGGMDSRLIALMLKRIGYENIITFSYGIPGNKEADISKEVADNLNLPWKFIDYSTDVWYEWFHSEERKSYYRIANNLTSVPHIQDWPAVWELKQRLLIPEDSIFIPGHSADLLAGSRSETLPYLYYSRPLKKQILVQAIINYHYSLKQWGELDNKFADILQQKIFNEFNSLETFPDSASAFEAWDIKERQAKFIINSVRVYEYWGYDWWLPLWDSEFIDFWSHVPLKYRINRKFYRNYMINLDSRLANTDDSLIKIKNIKNHRLNMMKKTIKKLPCIYQITIKINQALNKYSIYDNHPLAWYGIMEKETFYKNYTGRENINSFLALEELGLINF